MTFLTVYVNLLPIFFGAIIGSFLNVVIARWPEDESVISPRSACPQCKKTIAWYDNIPVLSWLFLRARCRNCGLPISWRYPAVEILTAVLSWMTFIRFVPGALVLRDPSQIDPLQVLTYLIYFGMVASLVAITFIDFAHYYIPDELSLGGIVVGVLAVAALEGLGGGIVTWKSSLLGVAIGAGSLALVRWIYYLVRKDEGMGLGDVKMMGMLGAFLGAHPALLFIIFISSFLGSTVGITMMVLYGKDMKYPLPFGPFLAIGGIIYLLWGYRWAGLFIPTDLPPGLLSP